MAEMIHYDPTTQLISNRDPVWPPAVVTVSDGQLKSIGYRQDCMKGDPHPLGIEKYDYHLVEIKTVHIDNAEVEIRTRDKFLSAVNQIITEPAIEWAVDNSFDGLYILQEFDISRLSSRLKLGVYLHAEHATFWSLKYEGTQ